MKTNKASPRLKRIPYAIALMALALGQYIALAAAPVVKTVPWVPSNPLIPHTTFTGKTVTLKGTCDQQGSNFKWTWDFGDGSAVATGTITDRYVIEAKHAYSGAVGTIYTARLTVQNTTTGETGTKFYYVQMLDKTLDTEVNVAIDEGLWYLHKAQERSDPYGYWYYGNTGYGGYASLGYYGVSVANLNAFEVNGHSEVGDPSNPYVETVQRAMKALFAWLKPINIGLQDPGGRNPDANNNGIGVVVNQSYEYYQGGMFMDAIVASGTPNAIATTGPAGVLGRTYKDILQDMADAYAWAQYDGSTGASALGGWRYSANQFPDNSACQWAAIGLIAAERNWGCTIPAWVLQRNIPWLKYTQAGNGSFGYTDTSAVWGPYATTPSGMVQLVMDGIGRGVTGTGYPSWEKAETFMRNNFGNTGGAQNAVKDYYYGLFSFVKAMLLHNGGGGPIVMLHSQTAGVPDLNWYRAEVSQGDPTDGVARTLVGDQNSVGYWYGHNMDGNQYHFETAWAIMMLHQTVFESGIPVAIIKAIPNPSVAGQIITLDGSDSYHQDANKHIVSWEWDVDADGIFETTGPVVQTSFSGTGNYPVKLRVTDDAGIPKTAEATMMVLVTTPPVAPTADANGPYVFCDAITKWFLDGRNSVNPDEGKHELGCSACPGDTIIEYAWDLNGDQVFNDAFGPTIDVKAFFMGQGVGSYLVSLRVTDRTAASYPSSGWPDQVSQASAVVHVVEDCACVTLTATPVIKNIQLNWTSRTGASGYNVYRSEVAGGPYLWIGVTTETSFLDDSPGPLDQVYYYVVRPARLNGDEICQSNEASAEPLHPAPVASCVVKSMSNTGKYYYTIDASSKTFGHMQLGLYVKDTVSGNVVGPLPPGCVIYLRTGLPAFSVRAGSGAIERYIMTKGSALVWAQDPMGQKSVPIVP